jgi:hypothetical protein
LIDSALYNEASIDGSEQEQPMNKLVLAVAAVILLSFLAAGIAAAVSAPGSAAVSANSSPSPASEVAAAGKQRLLITDDSIFSQFGFCDDNADAGDVSAAY